MFRLQSSSQTTLKLRIANSRSYSPIWKLVELSLVFTSLETNWIACKKRTQKRKIHELIIQCSPLIWRTTHWRSQTKKKRSSSEEEWLLSEQSQNSLSLVYSNNLILSSFYMTKDLHNHDSITKLLNQHITIPTQQPNELTCGSIRLAYIPRVTKKNLKLDYFSSFIKIYYVIRQKEKFPWASSTDNRPRPGRRNQILAQGEKTFIKRQKQLCQRCSMDYLKMAMNRKGRVKLSGKFLLS